MKVQPKKKYRYGKDLIGHCCMYASEEESELNEMELWWNLFDGDDIVEKVAQVNIRRIYSPFKSESAKLCWPGYDLFEVMDDEDIDKSTVAIELGFMPEYYERRIMPWAPVKELRTSDLYYIENVYVSPEYRNSGIGTEILHRIKPMVSRFFREKNPFLVLLASPVEMEHSDPEFGEMKMRLRKFYLRNGFGHIQADTDTMVYDGILRHC